MLHIVIAESELELVPAELARNPIIEKSAARWVKRPQEILLDSNLHHSAMLVLGDAHRRGRPDIVHVCLLFLLDSPLNNEGMLRSMFTPAKTR